ncbi:MAG: hypothetical protein ACTHW1_06960 [Ancrocorticia sp.]|uniref:hypothetical protein n=1 Tax=Ancrocorticia sp. TaxID=2593684 RepID=UPI003F91D1D6
MDDGEEFAALLESAARFQEIVPDAVLVGGTAAAFHAHHRVSYDHDHVVKDLRSRYDQVLDALESTPEFTVSNRASRAPNTIMGKFDEHYAGLRNLRRRRPLEVESVTLASGRKLRVPTELETLRVKAYLVVQRNAVRDYLDVAALSSHLGLTAAADTLRSIDEYYVEHSDEYGSVLTELVLRLSDPLPRDRAAIRTFEEYKGVHARWQKWSNVVNQCQQLSAKMV